MFLDVQRLSSRLWVALVCAKLFNVFDSSLISLVSQHLFASQALVGLRGKLDQGDDAVAAVPLSARALLVAANFVRVPRTTLVLVSGEVAADQLARELRLWLPAAAVLRLPLLSYQPWREGSFTEDHVAAVGQRARALSVLQGGYAGATTAGPLPAGEAPTGQLFDRKTPTGQPPVEAAPINRALLDCGSAAAMPEVCIDRCFPGPALVVASARALLGRLPPPGSLPASLRLVQGQPLPDSLSWDDLPLALVQRGYERNDQANLPGSFSRRGDTVDVWPAGLGHPVRIELFGDDVEALRRLVPLTGQSIGMLAAVDIWPARDVVLDERSAQRALRCLYALQGENIAALPTGYRQHIESIEAGNLFAELPFYLPWLYEQTANPLDYLAKDALVVAIEPRSLFDDANRYFDEQQSSVERHISGTAAAKAALAALFTKPGELDFGAQQRLSLLAMIAGAGGLDLRLEVKHPGINGSEERLAAAASGLLKSDYLTLVCEPNHRLRSEIELALSDAHVSFVERRSEGEQQPVMPAANIAMVCDLALPTALSVPAARLALLSLTDNSAVSVARRGRGGTSGVASRRRVDPTSLTFPFKPGDYVVHEAHGIALFRQILSQEVAGIQRDYLHLEYAKGDKLFTPVEQIARVTRYIGSDSAAPRLTRLNTSDWARASGKARKAARQLAFDLIELYSQRIAEQGFAYAPDNELQYQMELAFPYEETPDQLAAIADVKANMESSRPMDRLICGDVGFGKTEVAIRAAFKAIQGGKQVMLLAPTTILAQQHYTTFSERFEPFAVNVDVLSRFRTAAEQKAILKRFGQGRLEMLVGTHRLLSADVNPLDLGLVIIDEEQRFGVQNKEQLKKLREQTDVLTLTATPIPRTLQMALSGVRDMSLIDTPPTSRTPVRVQVGEWNEDVVSAAIRHEVGRGGQVYYVSNRVRSIDDATSRVMAVAPEVRIGVAHGQMSPRQLEDVMERFAAGQFDVLVSTTIIESGLDNPHTNTLIIEDSQRLGLAQLYQLKGRVGRSHDQAYAYFLFPSESSLTPEAVSRLTAIDEFQDLGSGMKVAMRDLEIRGAGALLGAEQSGNLSAVGFDLFTSMINEAVRTAEGQGQAVMREFADGSSGKNSEQKTASAKDVSEVRVELPVPCLFPEEYMAAADERVLYYRRLAAALDLETIDELQSRLEGGYGALPAAASNLLDRNRVRLLAVALGITSITVQRQAFVLEGLVLGAEQAAALKAKGGLYFVKSHRLQYPVSKEQQADSAYHQLLELLDGLLP